MLFKLCLILTKSTKESLIAVYVFCFNPASIFFSSLYTESIYLSFTLMALIILYERKDYLRYPIASCLFSFTYLTRANGILNIGYIGFLLMLETVVRKDANDRLRIEKSTWRLVEKVNHFNLFATSIKYLGSETTATTNSMFVHHSFAVANFRLVNGGTVLQEHFVDSRRTFVAVFGTKFNCLYTSWKVGQHELV